MNNNTVTGIIQDIIERPLSNGKFAYDVFIINDERQFGAGFKRPQANVGDSVSFNFFVNAAGYNNIVGQVRVVAKAAQSAGGIGLPDGVSGAALTSTQASKQGVLNAAVGHSQEGGAIWVAGQVHDASEALTRGYTAAQNGSTTAAPAHRQQAWGFAANRAIDFLTLAHHCNALKLAAKNKADNLDALKGLLDGYTEMFYTEAVNAKVIAVPDNGVAE